MTMCIQLCFAIIGSIILTSETHFNGVKYDYLFPFKNNTEDHIAIMGCFNTGVWFVALMNFVPISLLVTLESINVTQGLFISWDVDIYDAERDLPTRV